MNFKYAMKLLCEGWKVRRTKWHGDEYIEVKKSVFSITDHDMGSTDWEVKEVKKEKEMRKWKRKKQ
jgi:hypothetical protein